MYIFSNTFPAVGELRPPFLFITCTQQTAGTAATTNAAAAFTVDNF
jgi:hypothetical protein